MFLEDGVSEDRDNSNRNQPKNEGVTRQSVTIDAKIEKESTRE